MCNFVEKEDTEHEDEEDDDERVRLSLFGCEDSERMCEERRIMPKSQDLRVCLYKIVPKLAKAFQLLVGYELHHFVLVFVPQCVQLLARVQELNDLKMWEGNVFS